MSHIHNVIGDHALDSAIGYHGPSAFVHGRIVTDIAMPVKYAINKFAHAPQLQTHYSTISLSWTPPTIFSSRESEDLDAAYNKWLTLPIPPKKQLLALENQANNLKTFRDRSAVQPCSFKILDASGTVYAPLWIPTFWLLLRRFICRVHSWSTVIKELKQVSQKPFTYSNIASIALAWANNLEVNGSISALEPFRTYLLARFLNHRWLPHDNINAVGQYINSHPSRLRTLRVLESYFLCYLENRFRNASSSSHCQPHSIESLVVSQAVKELLIPVDRSSHWTLIYVNTQSQTYSNADTLDPNDLSGPESAIRLINHWLSIVFKKKIVLKPAARPFRLSKQTDSTSCGVAVLSTMAHYALQGTSVFDAWDQSASYIHRLKWFLLLCHPSEANERTWFHLYLPTVQQTILALYSIRVPSALNLNAATGQVQNIVDAGGFNATSQTLGDDSDSDNYE
ncbi:Ulp1 protease family, C-terminal catalytic domain, partial [Rhizoctonia solani]